MSREASTWLVTADTGFDATNVISIALDLKPSGYDESRGRAFFDDLLASVRTEPGIEAATLAAVHPMTLVDSGVQRVWIEGYDPRSEEDLLLPGPTPSARTTSRR